MKFITLTGGHGGTDSGAVGNGHKEKDVAMQFANLVSKYLKIYYTGVVITVQQEKTTKGEFKSVSAYWNKSNTGGGYSFHLNSNSGTPGHGTEVLKGKFGSTRCDAVNHALAKWFDNRGVKNTDTNNFYMLREAGFDGIFEICFINNASDMKILMDNIEEIAKEVALAIGKVEGLTEKKGGQVKEFYFFEATELTRYTQFLYDGSKFMGKAKSMLKCINDTYIYEDRECTVKNSGLKKGSTFVSLGNCGYGYNKKGYYTHDVITEYGKFYVCYKKK